MIYEEACGVDLCRHVRELVANGLHLHDGFVELLSVVRVQ